VWEWNFVVYGALATIVVMGVMGTTVLFPSVSKGGVRLGIVGKLALGISVSLVMDSEPWKAFLSALLAVALASTYSRNRENSTTIPLSVDTTWGDGERLLVIRRKLAILETNAAVYAAGEVPASTQLMIESAQEEVRDLTQRIARNE
jgi:hypothetical protein